MKKNIRKKMDHLKTENKKNPTDEPEKLPTNAVTEDEAIPKEEAATSKVDDTTSKAEGTVPKVGNEIALEEDDGEKLLDLAFAMDCTGSMGSQIDAVRESIFKIVEEIVSSEHADVHMALVEYRDHPPQDFTFITRPHDFTPSVRTMKRWLEGCSPEGGGDRPEAVADALYDLVKLSWRPGSTRVAVLISDAPPHGLGEGRDGFPNGCPLGLDPMEIGRQLAAKSVTVYTVGCGFSGLSGRPRDFLMALSHITGGQYVPLGNSTLLSKVIISGAREEISLQALMGDVNQEVDEEINALAEDNLADQEAVAKNIFSKFKANGLQANRMQQKSSSGETADLPTINTKAKKMSKMMTLADLRKNCVDTSKDRGSSSRRGVRSKRKRGKAGAADLDSEDLFCDVAASWDVPINDYNVVTEDLTLEQASRMVTKSIASKNLGTKMKR